MLSGIRESALGEVCADIATRLVKGQAAAGSVWDAVHLAGGELQMRVPRSGRITGIHAVTSANGLHHSYLRATDPATRHLILLQAVGWMAQFRTAIESAKDGPRKFNIAGIEPASGSDPLALAPSDPDAAAAQIVRIAADVRARQSLQAELVRLTIPKADEVHFYKYLASLIEDVPLVSPEWQPYLFAATVFYSKGAKDADAPFTKSAREALGGSAA
jgi:hypothetical protein